MRVSTAFLLLALGCSFGTSSGFHIPQMESMPKEESYYFSRHLEHVMQKYVAAMQDQSPDRDFNMKCTFNAILKLVRELSEKIDCTVEDILHEMGVSEFTIEDMEDIIEDRASIADMDPEDCEDFLYGILKGLIELLLGLLNSLLGPFAGILEGIIGPNGPLGGITGSILGGDDGGGILGGLFGGEGGGLLVGAGGLLGGEGGGLIGGLLGGKDLVGGLLGGEKGSLIEGLLGGEGGGLLGGLLGGNGGGFDGGLLGGEGGLLGGLLGGKGARLLGDESSAINGNLLEGDSEGVPRRGLLGDESSAIHGGHHGKDSEGVLGGLHGEDNVGVPEGFTGGNVGRVYGGMSGGHKGDLSEGQHGKQGYNEKGTNGMNADAITDGGMHDIRVADDRYAGSKDTDLAENHDHSSQIIGEELGVRNGYSRAGGDAGMVRKDNINSHNDDEMNRRGLWVTSSAPGGHSRIEDQIPEKVIGGRRSISLDSDSDSDNGINIEGIDRENTGKYLRKKVDKGELVWDRDGKNGDGQTGMLASEINEGNLISKGISKNGRVAEEQVDAFTGESGFGLSEDAFGRSNEHFHGAKDGKAIVDASSRPRGATTGENSAEENDFERKKEKNTVQNKKRLTGSNSGKHKSPLSGIANLAVDSNKGNHDGYDGVATGSNKNRNDDNILNNNIGESKVLDSFNNRVFGGTDGSILVGALEGMNGKALNGEDTNWLLGGHTKEQDKNLKGNISGDKDVSDSSDTVVGEIDLNDGIPGIRDRGVNGVDISHDREITGGNAGEGGEHSHSGADVRELTASRFRLTEEGSESDGHSIGNHGIVRGHFGKDTDKEMDGNVGDNLSKLLRKGDNLDSREGGLLRGKDEGIIRNHKDGIANRINGEDETFERIIVGGGNFDESNNDSAGKSELILNSHLERGGGHLGDAYGDVDRDIKSGQTGGASASGNIEIWSISERYESEKGHNQNAEKSSVVEAAVIADGRDLGEMEGNNIGDEGVVGEFTGNSQGLGRVSGGFQNIADGEDKVSGRQNGNNNGGQGVNGGVNGISRGGSLGIEDLNGNNIGGSRSGGELTDSIAVGRRVDGEFKNSIIGGSGVNGEVFSSVVGAEGGGSAGGQTNGLLGGGSGNPGNTNGNPTGGLTGGSTGGQTNGLLGAGSGNPGNTNGNPTGGLTGGSTGGQTNGLLGGGSGNPGNTNENPTGELTGGSTGGQTDGLLVGGSGNPGNTNGNPTGELKPKRKSAFLGGADGLFGGIIGEHIRPL